MAGIRIDELDATVLPSRDHVVPAMKDGLTVKLTIGQILDLLGKVLDPDEVGSKALFAALNLSDLDDPEQARANLGLGNSATRNVGTTAGTVAAGDDPRFDVWASQPIGVPIPLLGNLGAASPPTDRSYRYIKLTASDAYNTGVLTGESVTGSAPLIVATAVVSLPGSPVNGQTVHLINTERRFLRAGTGGVVENDQMQGHYHNSYATASGAATGAAGRLLSASLNDVLIASSVKELTSDGTNGTPRVGNETRPKNIGVTYFMRIL